MDIDIFDQQNMPCWYYEREELYKTPSYYDNIDYETESKHRREGARFLFDVSGKLNLRYDTCATAIVTAACCLMLAGKVEETPKKVRDIVKTAHSLLSDEEFRQFGSDPREEVMAYERVLLKTIKFDLQVSHPYSFLLQFVKKIKGNQEKLKELVQMSWSFINDSLATTLCLQWEPEILACAVLYLATRMNKYTIEDWEGRKPGLRWWECFVPGMSNEVMEDICHKILDLYPSESNRPSNTSKMTKSTNQSATNFAPKSPYTNGPSSVPIHTTSLQSHRVFKPELTNIQQTSSKRPKYDHVPTHLPGTNPTAPVSASHLPITSSSTTPIAGSRIFRSNKL